jgi:hypothetical protein
VPDVPVGAEAGLFRRLVRGLFRVPAKVAEDGAGHDAAAVVYGQASHDYRPYAETATHTELRHAVANGLDTNGLVYKSLSEAGPEGEKALRILNSNGNLKIVYCPGGGSFFDDYSGTVFISVENGDTAAGLIHESTHVEAELNGTHARMNALGKSDYVNAVLSEEAEANSREIYANIHLQQTNPHLHIRDTALQSHFTAGYNAAAQQAEAEARAAGRSLSPNDRAIAGNKGGTQAVLNEFQSGRIRTSGTNEPYPDYYARRWDSTRPR